MKHLLRFLYIFFELSLIVGVAVSIFGAILASAENNVIMTVLYAINAGVCSSGFGLILAILINERDYIW